MSITFASSCQGWVLFRTACTHNIQIDRYSGGGQCQVSPDHSTLSHLHCIHQFGGFNSIGGLPSQQHQFVAREDCHQTTVSKCGNAACDLPKVCHQVVHVNGIIEEQVCTCQFKMTPPTASSRSFSVAQVDCDTGRSAIKCHTELVRDWRRAVRDEVRTEFVEVPLLSCPPIRQILSPQIVAQASVDHVRQAVGC